MLLMMLWCCTAVWHCSRLGSREGLPTFGRSQPFFAMHNAAQIRLAQIQILMGNEINRNTNTYVKRMIIDQCVSCDSFLGIFSLHSYEVNIGELQG